jgi:hypothetical protein
MHHQRLGRLACQSPFVAAAFLLSVATSRLAQAQNTSSGVLDFGNSLTTVPGRCAGSPSSLFDVAFACPRDSRGVMTLTNGGVIGTYRSAASVGGPLRAASTITVASQTGDRYLAGASASYYDRFTVTGGGAAFLRFEVELDGVGSVTGTDRSGINLLPHYATFNVLNFGLQDVVATLTAESINTADVTINQFVSNANAGTRAGFVDVPLIGSVNNLMFSLSAVSSVARPSTVAAGAAWSATASSDFMNTLRITGVSALDAQRRDLTGTVTIASASGTVAVVTPEPRAWALFGTGLVGLLSLSARRRRCAG